MSNIDQAHIWTEERLTRLEKKIAEVYRQAYEERDKSVDAFFEWFEKADEKKRKQLEEEKITEKKYEQWRLDQMMTGNQYKAMRDKLAERMTHVNEIAIAYINDSTPGIYSLNRNWAAYKIEQAAGNCDFTLFDERTVKRLITEEPDLMPNYPKEKALNRGIDLEYGKKQITASVTSGILQGKTIPSIARDLTLRISEMNKNSAIRSARTATTGAQNAGRLDGYNAAADMGIKLRKQWLATLDGRTRHSHAQLDETIVERDKPFANGCMFPGDPNGRPEEIYNCRCTMIAVLDDEPYENAKRRARDPETDRNVVISDMTYSEWESWKEKDGKKGIFAKKINSAKKKSNIYDELKSLGVEYNKVQKRKNKLTEEEIIAEISGGDMTSGSCASAALAYLGQKLGYDVHDFRGGKSRDWFSNKKNKVEMFKMLGATVEEENTYKTSLANAKKMLKKCVEGKEYYLQAGRHAAVVRLNDGDLQYLELQSNNKNEWKYFDSKQYGIDDVLKGRFKCSGTSGNVPTVYMTDVDQIKDKNKFIKILGYINTSSNKQMKGERGGTK